MKAADPEIVFETWYTMDMKPDDLVPGVLTYKDGRYMTYREWYGIRTAAEPQGGADVS